MATVVTTCPRCDLGDHATNKREDGVRHRPTTPTPDIDQLMEWESEGGCEATDGCWVEPDGRCEHGHTAWLRAMGMI